MARTRELEYKPLLYTTTMRNPERLKYMLYVLAKFERQRLDDNLAIKICGETIRYGLYRPMKKLLSVTAKWTSTSQGSFSDYMLTDEEVYLMLCNNPQSHKEAGFGKGWPSRFATIYDLTKELGLAYFWPGEPIEISDLGKHLLKSINVEIDPASGFISNEVTHPEYEQQVFLQAMAKSQRKNPFVRVLNDNIPLILLLQVIRKLNVDTRWNGCGISRRELPLLIFWKDNDAEALYQRIVKLRELHRYDPSDEVITGICLDEIMEGNFKDFDMKSIMVDYPDEFIRKMRMTGLFSIRGAGRFVDINKNENEKVDYVLENYSHYQHFDNERAYFDYMAQLDENLINIESTPVTANNSETLLRSWLLVYNWDAIKRELGNLSSRRNSTDNVLKLISAPSRLEFLTALAIKSRFPKVRVIPNYSCDDTGLPTSTAGGNKGDIECYEQSHGILVEVTMATGRTQTMMEVWPIERHLDEFQQHQESQCIFVAPTIFGDSMRQIEFVAYQSHGQKKIRPYAIEELIGFLENYQCLYDNSPISLTESSMLSNFADFQMYQNNGISPLNLTAMLQKEYGEQYPLMDRSKWHKLAKAYISQKTMRYDVPDDEPVTWKMAAEPFQPSMKC
jgi:hypothetical protein